MSKKLFKRKGQSHSYIVINPDAIWKGIISERVHGKYKVYIYNGWKLQLTTDWLTDRTKNILPMAYKVWNRQILKWLIRLKCPRQTFVEHKLMLLYWRVLVLNAANSYLEILFQ